MCCQRLLSLSRRRYFTTTSSDGLVLKLWAFNPLLDLIKGIPAQTFTARERGAAVV
jgi:hypothetical protein